MNIYIKNKLKLLLVILIVNYLSISCENDYYNENLKFELYLNDSAFNKIKQKRLEALEKKLLIKNKSDYVLGSLKHNNKEIKNKELQNVKVLFLSSLFKQNKNYLGINKFKLLSNLTKNKVVALGGISSKNIKKIKLVNCYGFAGISYFE